MSLKWDGADLGTSHRVDYRQAAIAIADDDVSIAGIDANIIRVLVQVDPTESCEIRGPEEPHGAITGIRNENEIGLIRIRRALRLTETMYPLEQLPGSEIGDLDGIISQRRHDETLPGAIDRHVIDASPNVRERDRRFERKGSRLGRTSGCRRQHDARQNKGGKHPKPLPLRPRSGNGCARCHQFNGSMAVMRSLGRSSLIAATGRPSRRSGTTLTALESGFSWAAFSAAAWSDTVAFSMAAFWALAWVRLSASVIGSAEMTVPVFGSRAISTKPSTAAI
jgi:hypothetical protein